MSERQKMDQNEKMLSQITNQLLSIDTYEALWNLSIRMHSKLDPNFDV